jgi:glutathionylspermidine synthase
MATHCELSPALSPQAYRRYRLDAIFLGHKWDPQVFDRSTIADRAILVAEEDWSELSAAAETLFAETLLVERTLHRRARESGQTQYLPRRAARRLADLAEPSATNARLMRFDFHPTSDGWRLSEVNSDVPGGLNEATVFQQLWPSRSRGWRDTGQPGESYVQELTKTFALGASSRVGLIHATAYSDDWQHMAFLRDLLARRGIEAIGVAPTSIELDAGRMLVDGKPLDAALRFFPGDWLLFSREGTPWFARHPTSLSNPLHALFSQNKFFPVACATADVAIPTWQRYLPQTAALGIADLVVSSDVAKPSFGRVGEGIAAIPRIRMRDRVGIAMDVLLAKGTWVRQARFDSVNVGSQREPRHVCIGVYCVEGKAVGCYGRISPQEIVGMSAADAPVFVTN